MPKKPKRKMSISEEVRRRLARERKKRGPIDYGFEPTPGIPYSEEELRHMRNAKRAQEHFEETGELPMVPII